MQALSQRLLKVGKSEVPQAAALFALVVIVAFGDVVFVGHILLPSNIAPGTLPTGAYGYGGKWGPILSPP